VGPPESTSKGWILLFYGSESKTGSTSGVFRRNLTLFKFKRSQKSKHKDLDKKKERHQASLF
jgi:hypothetical protein